MTNPAITFDGVLFFPVTPFDQHDQVALATLEEHVASRLDFGPGAIFPACGTGEFHALNLDEYTEVVSTTVRVTAGRSPVIAGAGGAVGVARQQARAAEAAGADALLLLPPYLVAGPTSGLEDYVTAVVAASSLPVILYHRGTAIYSAELVRRLADNPKIIGLKDGHGDIGLAQEIVLAVAASGRKDFQFFNGLLTAELSQGAYKAIGIPLYSSAAFAMIPQVANGYYSAYTSGDDTTRLRYLSEFYAPLVRLRDEVPGFGVSLIKAGLRLRGLDVGSVRAPLVNPSASQLLRLGAILDAGDALVEELAPSPALLAGLPS